MSNLRPLKSSTDDDFAKALLESASDDRSAPGACVRALGTLGLGAGVAFAAGSTTSATASIASGAVPPAAGAAGGSLAPAGLAGGKVGVLLVMKWVGIGMLGGAVTLGSAHYIGTPKAVPATDALATPSGRDAPQQMSTATPLAIAPIPSTIEPLVDGRELRPNPSGSPGTSEHGELRSPAGQAPASSPAQASRSPGDTTGVGGEAPAEGANMMAQLGSLRSIRLSLAAHEAPRALVLLDDFDRRYPSSPLAEEVTVLRIDALADVGRRAEAVALGTAFLRASPQSAYGQRVRSKLKLP